MAIFAEVTENECIIERTCATCIHYPFTVTTHWHMYAALLKFVMNVTHTIIIIIVS